MLEFKCPVCGEVLTENKNTMICPGGHSFDISKQRYVNLLMSNKSSQKRHGDDRLMVKARYDFFNRGFYTPVLRGALGLINKIAGETPDIIDAGCGECWYTHEIYSALAESGRRPDIMGIDISKDALIYGAKRSKQLKLAVASVSHLPVRDESADIVLNFFAPLVPDEYYRVLKPGGHFIRAIPLERHLLSLKAAVYDEPYLNDSPKPELDGFAIADSVQVKQNIHLGTNEDIINLFSMTPYYYKTGEKDQAKLSKLTELDTELEVLLLAYRRL